MYGWLAEYLPLATSFACQTGYYRFDALEPFAKEIGRILKDDGRFDLVIGANEDRLNVNDLERTLELIGEWIPDQASVTVIGASVGLFHPKTYYAELSTGARVAAVGSANLTWPGITHHIEACVFLNDSEDDPLVVDAVRDAIIAWRTSAKVDRTGNSRPLTQELITQLAEERIIDPIPSSPPESRARASGPRTTFPPLPVVPGIPARRAKARPRNARALKKLRGAVVAFPPGTAGLVKRLSKNDVKGFTAQPGTPYIALPANPAVLATRLPLRPAGKHNEPRLDVVLECRLDGALREPVSSSTDPANIQHVGEGTTKRSHRDLRLNIPKQLHDDLNMMALREKLRRPAAGDMAAIEFLDEGKLLRITFASHDPLKKIFASHLEGKKSWGWLPTGVVPPW